MVERADNGGRKCQYRLLTIIILGKFIKINFFSYFLKWGRKNASVDVGGLLLLLYCGLCSKILLSHLITFGCL